MDNPGSCTEVFIDNNRRFGTGLPAQRSDKIMEFLPGLARHGVP
jgi:hypothetical protein